MAALSMFDLTDRVAIVTGGGHGISKAVAIGFAQAGAHVAVVDKVPERAEATSAAIEDLGRESLFDTAHIGYEDKASGFVGRVLDKFGRVDILFNGAGGMRTADGLYYEKPVEELTEDVLDEVIRNNMKSCFFMCKAVGPTMLDQGKGSIINVSSVSGYEPSPRRTPYGISKAGITNFTKSLAAEWGPKRCPRQRNMAAGGDTAPRSTDTRTRRTSSALRNASQSDVSVCRRTTLVQPYSSLPTPVSGSAAPRSG